RARLQAACLCLVALQRTLAGEDGDLDVVRGHEADHGRGVIILVGPRERGEREAEGKGDGRREQAHGTWSSKPRASARPILSRGLAPFRVPSLAIPRRRAATQVGWAAGRPPCAAGGATGPRSPAPPRSPPRFGRTAARRRDPHADTVPESRASRRARA